MDWARTDSFLDLAKLLEALTKGLIICMPRKAALVHFIYSELTTLALTMKGEKSALKWVGKVKAEEHTARRA